MGYETKLFIGNATGLTGPQYDDDRNAIEGKTETYFQVYAMVDLCKCGSNSHIARIDFKNTDENHRWYFYGPNGGNETTTEDCYGDRPRPVPIKEVVEALRKDAKAEGYRRFKWALALLESMLDDKEDDITVLFYGY